MAPPKKPWFRMYVEAVSDIKLRRLKPEVRWLFVACLAAARQSPIAGWLVAGTKPMDWDELADFAAMSRKQVRDGMVLLLDAGLIEYDTTIGGWRVPKWGSRQFESDLSTERVLQHRAKSRSNADATPDETVEGAGCNAPETEGREQRTEPPPPESEEPPAAPGPGGGIDSVLNEAAHLLAAAEADRRGDKIGNPGGYIRARIKPIRDDHEPEWRRLLDDDPNLTAAQLAAGRTSVTAEDRSVQAMRAVMDRNAERAAAEPAPVFDPAAGIAQARAARAALHPVPDLEETA